MSGYWCLCETRCGDDGDNEGPGTCKGLPLPPREPLVVFELVHRDDLRRSVAADQEQT